MATYDYKTMLSMREERKIIEKKYNDRFRKKLFKLKWMNWGLIDGSKKIVVDKIWIIDIEGNVGFYQLYTQNCISDLVISKMSNENFNALINLLNAGFENEKDCHDACDGIGYEMILYDDFGKIKHKFCGYIYHNDYLQEIVKLVKKDLNI